METASRLAMSPVRVMSRWLLVPMQFMVSVAIGMTLGWFSGWVSARTLDHTSYVYLIGISPALWVVCVAAIGTMTRSWTFAVVFGVACAMSARAVDHLATYHYLDSYVAERTTLVAEVPFALVAGAVFGWAGSVWRYDEGMIRSAGTSLVAGVLVWDGWNFVRSESIRGDSANVYGWMLLGAAALVVVLARQPAAIALASLGSIGIAWALDRAFDSHIDILRPMTRELIAYLRELFRSFQDILR